MIVRCSAILFISLFASSANAQPTAKTDPSQLRDFFETKVRPVLAENCYKCHGPEKQRSGIRVDGRAHLLKGNEVGPLIVVGDSKKSSLIKAIRHEGEAKMPPDKKLPESAIRDLATWIDLGAYWPEDKGAVVAEAAWKKHWAFQRLANPQPPFQGEERNPIDGFVRAKLESKGLKQNSSADRRTLLRRLKLDLLGLPVTLEEVQEFEQDPAPDAYEKWVERYLASPHYGERWARHWMDVARYADTKGYVFQEERRYAFSYTYRDYLIKAFNDDVPFNQFIKQQLAADRLVAANQAEPRTQAAMGFLTLGRRFLNNVHDIIDDRLDLIGRGLLGLSIGCARCHDHKSDPIAMKDYYGMYGIFASSHEPKDGPLLEEMGASSPERLAFEKKLADLTKSVQDYEAKFQKELAEKNRKNRDELRALQKKVDALKATSAAAPPRAMVLNDNPSPVEPVIFLRGNPNNRGPRVPRQFIEAINPVQGAQISKGSGRLELAEALVHPDNPLTPRVFVNRVWMHHFGTGLVATPSDFGVQTDPPSHPELLDFLARKFIAEGWSIKKLHRWIVTSKTYQASANEHIKAREIDPDNRLLARSNRRRLDFESLRDAMLSVSGRADLKLHGASVDIFKTPYSGRRSVYAFIERQNLPGAFRTFDFASPDTTNPQRFQTSVPQQALFLLNHPFVQEAVRAVLSRPELESVSDSREKIQRLHRLLFARSAEEEEIRMGLDYLEKSRQESPSESNRTFAPWQRYTQVLLVSNEFLFAD